MTFEAMLFMLAVILAALLLFVIVFSIFMFEDLKVDYVNPVDFSKRLNEVSKYEHLGQAGLTLVFLVTLSWTPFLLNVPLLAYHVNNLLVARYLNGQHKYDATKVITSVKRYETEGLIKLGFYLLSFFYYLYRVVEPEPPSMILALLEV